MQPENGSLYSPRKSDKLSDCHELYASPDGNVKFQTHIQPYSGKNEYRWQFLPKMAIPLFLLTASGYIRQETGWNNLTEIIL